MSKLGKIILPPAPAPGGSPQEVSSNVASWTRQAEQAIRKISTKVDTNNTLSSGTESPNGVRVGSIGDVYNQIQSGALIKSWMKLTGDETNQGWA